MDEPIIIALPVDADGLTPTGLKSQGGAEQNCAGRCAGRCAGGCAGTGGKTKKD